MGEFVEYFKTKKNLINLLLLGILLLGIPLGIDLLKKQQIIKSRAAADPIVFVADGNVSQKADGTWVAKTSKVSLQITSPLGPPGNAAPSAPPPAPPPPVGGPNLLDPSMQNGTITLGTIPDNQRVQWFNAGTYTLSGTGTNIDIQADEWSLDDSTFIKTHPNNSTFTIPSSSHVAIIVRLKSGASSGTYSNVSVTGTGVGVPPATTAPGPSVTTPPQNGGCTVTPATLGQASVSGNSVTLSWTPGSNNDAMYLNASTSNATNANGTLKTVNTINSDVSGKVTYSKTGLAEGNYYWNIVSSGCGQMVQYVPPSLGTFTIGGSGPNLLDPSMQDGTITLGTLPNNQLVQWFNAGTYTLSGIGNDIDIQGDEWSLDNSTYVAYHPNGSTFTVPATSHVAIIVRLKSGASSGSYSNVSLIKL